MSVAVVGVMGRTRVSTGDLTAGRRSGAIRNAESVVGRSRSRAGRRRVPMKVVRGVSVGLQGHGASLAMPIGIAGMGRRRPVVHFHTGRNGIDRTWSGTLVQRI